MRAPAVSIVCSALLAGCGEFASSDPGIGAPLYIANAQFRPGAFPGASGGPATAAVQTLHASAIIGEDRETISATLDPAARAGIVGLAGHDGAWIVPAGPPDFETPGFASLHATYGIDVAPGSATLLVAAVDAEDRIGPPASAQIVALEAPVPAGQLVISLQWDGRADLDLHVVDPQGNEAWSGDPDTWKPQPGVPTDPQAWMTGGILDHDGNAGCTRDGVPTEDVIWSTHMGATGPVDPIVPPGEYTVRVDARSMCGDASAAWAVIVTSQGETLATTRGIATPADVAYQPHGAGAGITALHFTL